MSYRVLTDGDGPRRLTALRGDANLYGLPKGSKGLCIYIYIHIHMYIHTYIHTDRQTDMRTHTQECIYIYIYVLCIYSYTYIHMYKHTHRYGFMNLCVYVLLHYVPMYLGSLLFVFCACVCTYIYIYPPLWK